MPVIVNGVEIEGDLMLSVWGERQAFSGPFTHHDELMHMADGVHLPVAFGA